ncbi:MAG TPA: FliH/SctL family protein [Acidobacteriota bacterium]|nr:FliH/SctL family protein [Acidobacteriota bacterium]
MSKIIRYSTEAPTVYVGERHEETVLEIRAEETLTEFFPIVSFVTSPNGAKLIPIQEVHKLKQVLDAERDKAYSAGFEKGQAEGLAEGQRDARQVLRQFEQALQDAIGQRESLLAEARQKVLELVIQVARKVTLDAISVDPEITATLISRVIDRLVDRSRLKIKVHPDFLPIVEQQTDRFLAGSTSIKDLTFEPDPRVRLGGCFIETPTGDIDARLESQFEVVQEAIRGDGDES